MRRRFILPLLVLSLYAASCTSGPAIPVVAEANESSAAQTAPEPPFTEISMHSQGQRVPVIMYHDVIAERSRDSQWFDCTAEEFAEHMLKLIDQGVTPISLDQLYRHLTLGEKIPDKAVVLTFDDNYQGYLDNAYPILKKYGFPSAVFVHTGFVGDKNGTHPKMDWDTLRVLVNDPLVTIGSHTISHPEDITTLDSYEQVRELQESKAVLERELGKSIPYLAYPNGKNDPLVQEQARKAGYTMAFSIDNGLAEESPTIMSVNRYVHTRFDKAFEDWDESVRGGAGLYLGPIKDAPVSYIEGEFEGVDLGMVKGGTPISLMSESREGVLEFINRTPGTVAGINGGFFAISEVAATDNRMVGPLKTGEMPAVLPDDAQERWHKLRNRPLIMWGPSGFGIVPYQPAAMRTQEHFENFMPGMTDTFMAGVWLVHGGVPKSKEDMNIFGASDIQDPRRRAFIGVTADGTMVLGAARQSVSSERVAKAIAAAGVFEAVLLDSGFSTSLVYGQSIKASGHSTKDRPSRPVPHAVLLKGTLDPVTESYAAPDPVAPEPAPRRKRRR